MENELENWLDKMSETYSEISRPLMDDLLNDEMSNPLYMTIPSNNNKHSEKIDYMMELLENANQPKEKKKINIVIADGSDSLEYIQFLSTEFEVNVVRIETITKKRDINLVLFTGGEDVNPEYYNEKVGIYTHINKKRDDKEVNCFHFFRGTGVPMLGICRGNQFLAVMNNAKLIQHVEGHGREHTIVVKGQMKPISITSTHHQMIYPFDLDKSKYELIAYSEFFKSKTYLNGKNEEIELSKEFLEPEIIYYPDTKCLGIQGHPEFGSCNPIAKKVCMKLIKKYLFNNDSILESSKSWYSNGYYSEDKYVPAHEEFVQHVSYATLKTKLKGSIYNNSIEVNPFGNLSYYENKDIGVKTIDKSSEKEPSSFDRMLEKLKFSDALSNDESNNVKETIIKSSWDNNETL